MNFALAKEIYGITPWCVDAISFHSLSGILKNIQSGSVLEIPKNKYNSIGLFKSENRIISYDFQLENNDVFDGIGVINLNGPIIKSSGASSVGMTELSQYIISMSNDNRIKGFILVTDSGGGSSAAVQVMVDAINKVKKEKPVYALIDKGGMAGSAAYGIISACTCIYSESELNIVGSVGTMIQFEAKPNGNVDSNGEKTIVLYATKSTKKNKAFEEAINNDNYKLLIDELLDPINESFIKQTLSNRPQLKGTNFDNGHTLFSKDAIGTFIDGIASFDEVVNMVISDSKNSNFKNKGLINNKKKDMTKQEFLQENPTAYNEIMQEGITKESERVKSWMAHKDTDFESVLSGISSGSDISASQTQQFLVKMTQKSVLGTLQAGSAKPIITNQSQTNIPDAIAVNTELDEAFDFDLK